MLYGDRLEWGEQVPDALSSAQAVAVHVTIVDLAPPASSSPSGQHMADILEQISRKTTLPSIADPVAWQQALRGDRSLPGRED